MRVLSRLILLILVLTFPVAACAGQGGPNGGAPTDQRADQTDATGNGNGNGETLVPLTPIDIPNITNAQGEFVDDVRVRLENELRDVCGGTVCVKLTMDARDDNLPRCRFSTTDPRPGTRVPRGSVVVIVTGTQPCDSSPAGGGGSPDDGESPNGGESPEGETSPDDETPSEGETSPG